MRPILDSHVHFWRPDRFRYAWLQEFPELNRGFLPTHLVREAMAVNLQGLVFVQADCAPEDGLREAAWVSEMAHDEPLIKGIVAFAPLEEGSAVAGYLEKLKELPLVKGVRRLLQEEPLGFALQPDFVRGVQKLAQFGFNFDICIIHPQLADVIRLVERCPDVAFVLDHLGKPAVKDRVMEPWATQLQELAEFPHVCCKLSGLVTEADHRQWTEADLRPYVDIALEAFGPDRLLFGGDWPVSELATTYQRWVQTAESLLSGLPEVEKHKLFFANAQKFYGLNAG